jgi:hypothetical protein
MRTQREWMRRGFSPEDAEWCARPTINAYGALVNWGAAAHRHRGLARLLRLGALTVGCRLYVFDRWVWRLGRR